MRQILKTAKKLFRDSPRPVILMYHRIADPAYDPWGLAVSAARFADQLDAIKTRRHPLPMTALVENLKSGTLDPRIVALTFDDGYVDNVTTAKPLLEGAGVPATTFLTTGWLGRTEEFWWDELAEMCLGGTTAVDCTIEIGSRSIVLRVPPQAVRVRSNWHWSSAPRTEREHAYLALCTNLRSLEDRERRAALESLRDCFGKPRVAPSAFPMRREDAFRLIDGGLITIGAHGQTHRPLTSVQPAERRTEIEMSKAECEALTGANVSGFAYPHGDLDDETKSLVRNAGFAWAVSTRSAALDTTHYDLFELPRLQVLNWTGSELMDALASLETEP
jgi:peptidoglycan/xylan/chitin deacetylase (PgdA/CDA1 family)